MGVGVAYSSAPARLVVDDESEGLAERVDCPHAVVEVLPGAQLAPLHEALAEERFA